MRSIWVSWATKTKKLFASKYLKKILSFVSSFLESYLVFKALLVQDDIRLSFWCYVCCNRLLGPIGLDVPQSPEGNTSHASLHLFDSFLLQLAWPTPIWCMTGWKLLSCLGSSTPLPDWTTWTHPSPRNASPCSTSLQKREYSSCIDEERHDVWPEWNVHSGEEVWAVLLSSWPVSWRLPTLNSLYWTYSLDLAVPQGNILGQEAMDKERGCNYIDSGTCSSKGHGELLWAGFKMYLARGPGAFSGWLLRGRVSLHCVF